MHATEFTAWTDGSVLKNPGGAGGWAFLLRTPTGPEYKASGGDPSTTNNRMEMQAIIEAARAARLLGATHLLVVSDSKYAIGVFSGAMRARANPDLVREWIEASGGLSVQFEWVKGHAGQVENELADRWAGEAARGRPVTLTREPECAIPRVAPLLPSAPAPAPEPLPAPGHVRCRECLLSKLQRTKTNPFRILVYALTAQQNWVSRYQTGSQTQVTIQHTPIRVALRLSASRFRTYLEWLEAAGYIRELRMETGRSSFVVPNAGTWNWEENEVANG
jgi:ribonuclease HI